MPLLGFAALAGITIGFALDRFEYEPREQPRFEESGPDVVRPASVAVTVVDGDTLKLGNERIRLIGIDAPEFLQRCADGWPAGRLATNRLLTLTSGKRFDCQQKDRDRYGRVVAVCRLSGEDLGAILVREGLAWAFTRYSNDYLANEARARAAKLGVHAHGCLPAWEWRAQHHR